jgi:hypothetical protein
MHRQSDRPLRPDHAAHDRTLVAALAAGDLVAAPAPGGGDLEAAALAEATELVATCPDCAELHADLVAIAAAVRELPAPVRTRDFRLSAGQAAALRPSGWRRLVAGLGSPRATVVRPLPITFTTLGLVGLLLASVPAAVPLGILGSAGGGDDFNATAGQSGDDGTVVGPEVAPGSIDVSAPEASGGDATKGDGGSGSESTGTGDRDAGAPGGPSPWLLVLSIALLAMGIGMLAARRLTRDR